MEIEVENETEKDLKLQLNSDEKKNNLVIIYEYKLIQNENEAIEGVRNTQTSPQSPFMIHSSAKSPKIQNNWSEIK